MSAPTSVLDVLGSNLQLPRLSGLRNTKEIIGGKRAVLLLFSAMWCPPCKEFARKLVTWYRTNKDKSDQELEIVFVSLDHSEAEYNRYSGSMPWPALPWSAAVKCREALVGYLGVGSIPAVVALDPGGKVLTTDGRRVVDVDPDAELFPWTDTLGSVLRKAGPLLMPDGTIGPTFDQLRLKHQHIALHFSAGWCEPCLAFRPVLLDWVKARTSPGGLDLAVVLVSMDRDESVFHKARAEYPFPALSWKARRVAGDAGRLLRVMALPTTAVIESRTGKVLTTRAADLIRKEPAGFPWPARPVEPPFTVWRRALEFRYTAVLLVDRCTNRHAEDVAREAFAAAAGRVFNGDAKARGSGMYTCVCGAEDPETKMVRKVTHLRGAAASARRRASSGKGGDASPRKGAAGGAGSGDADGSGASAEGKREEGQVEGEGKGEDEEGSVEDEELQVVVLRPTTDQCWYLGPRYKGKSQAAGAASGAITAAGLEDFFRDILGGKIEEEAVKFAE